MKKIELIFKKFLLLLLGGLLQKRNCRNDQLRDHNIESILFIRPEKIGDIFIAFPIFDILKKNYPDMKITILGSPDSLHILENDPRFYKIFLYKKEILSDLQMISLIRREKFDCVVDLVGCDSVTSLLLTALSSPGQPRLALGKNNFQKYYNFNFDLRRNNTGHMITNSLAVLDAFGLNYDKSDCYAPPFLNDADKICATSYLKSLILGEDSIMIGYNLSAGGPDRKIPEETSSELLNKILGYNNKIQVILFGLRDDRFVAERFIKRMPERVHLIQDNLTLTEASAVISRLDCFITPDTSLVHIARSFKVPVVAIYRNFMENYKIWYPYGQSDGVIVSNRANNIFDISAERIFSEFIKIADSITEKECQNSQS